MGLPNAIARSITYEVGVQSKANGSGGADMKKGLNLLGFVKGMLALILALTVGTSGGAQSLRWLGALSNSGIVPNGVSDDATVVVGNDLAPAMGFIIRAFRWTPATGIQLLDAPLDSWCKAYDVSADGRVVVGQAGNRAVRWENGVLYELGSIGGIFGEAHSVSADGSIIVGYAHETTLYSPRAFRWTRTTGMQILDPSFSEPSIAYAIASSGNAVAGSAILLGFPQAFRWTPATGIEVLNSSWAVRSIAKAISDDGNVVVGLAVDSRSYEYAFRWTSESGMQNIHTTQDVGSEVYDASADGQVVVGVCWGPYRWYEYPFVWTASTGMRNLNDVYRSLIPNGSVLYEVRAISSDGRYIVGSGYNGANERIEAYLLDTWRDGDTNGDGCIDDADLLKALFAFGSAGTGYTRHEDINKDGIVDDADLLMVLFNFGNGC